MKYIKQNLLPLISLIFILVISINQYSINKNDKQSVLVEKNNRLEKLLKEFDQKIEIEHQEIKTLQKENKVLILKLQDSYDRQKQVVNNAQDTYEKSKTYKPTDIVDVDQLNKLLAEYERGLYSS